MDLFATRFYLLVFGSILDVVSIIAYTAVTPFDFKRGESDDCLKWLPLALESCSSWVVLIGLEEVVHNLTFLGLVQDT